MILHIRNNLEKMKALNAYVSASYAAHRLREATHISPVTKTREQNQFKKVLEGLKSSLIVYEKEFEKLDKANPDAFEDTFNYFMEMMQELNSIEVYESDEFKHVIKAFKKDKKSILGITNKILK